MVELVKYIACSLVDKPEEVEVRQEQTENGLMLELKVAQSDIGKIIGKQGRMAKAMRTVLKAAATKQGINVVLEIL